MDNGTIPDYVIVSMIYFHRLSIKVAACYRSEPSDGQLPSYRRVVLLEEVLCVLKHQVGFARLRAEQIPRHDAALAHRGRTSQRL